MKTPDILCFGECMLELSRTRLGGDSWNLGIAGDSYNVAVYLKRLGCDVGYMTALGREEFSADIAAHWAQEGLSTDWALTHPDRLPGLYAIRLDDQGERSFSYWRGQSAARAFFECSGADALLHRSEQCKLLYLSGITLSLFDDSSRSKIGRLAQAVRANGGKVAFDSNYRAKGWPDKHSARRAIEAFAHHVDIALPTLEDDVALFGDKDAAACAARWRQLGVGEVAIKLGGDGAFIASGDNAIRIPAITVHNVRDTTGAGDSFNAAFLAARLQGADIESAGQSGCRLAAHVVQHPGAIIRRVLMPAESMRQNQATP